MQKQHVKDLSTGQCFQVWIFRETYHLMKHITVTLNIKLIAMHSSGQPTNGCSSRSERSNSGSSSNSSLSVTVSVLTYIVIISHIGAVGPVQHVLGSREKKCWQLATLCTFIPLHLTINICIRLKPWPHFQTGHMAVIKIMRILNDKSACFILLEVPLILKLEIWFYG